MASLELGHTLVIANPASRSGHGAHAAEHVQRFFESYGNATRSFDIEYTRAPLDAVEMAAQAGGMDTIIALGGDGVIHEVVNGLMAVDKRDRPRLGVIPMGSGNDFARTLNATFNKPETSLAELLNGQVRRIELGNVVSDKEPRGIAGTEGNYFMETLSFGLDAAIALDTTKRRNDGTKQEGATLFATSSLKIFSKASDGFACRLSLDGGEAQELRTIILAIQNGPTYGGGFRICPAAVPTDGLLSICHNTRTACVPHVLFLLALARFGKHTRSRIVKLPTCTHMSVEFMDTIPLCQIDGEELTGSRYDVRVVPDALEVIVPSRCTW